MTTKKFLPDPPIHIIAAYVLALSITTMLVMWFPIIILNFIGYEVFEAPPINDFEQFLPWMLYVLFVFLLNVAIWSGSAIADPVFVAVANVFTIPVSNIVDFVITRVLYIYIYILNKID